MTKTTEQGDNDMPMQTARALARIAENPVFSALEPNQLRHLFHESQTRQFQRGDSIFDAGQACEGLHAVLEGHVKVYARTPEGHEKVIDVVGRGHTLPGTHQVRTEPHSCHARALNDTCLLIVPHEVLGRELSADRGMAARLIDDACQQVRRMMREIEITSLCSASERVCDYLLNLPSRSEEARPSEAPQPQSERTVVLPVSKGVVASLLSITPEHFSRVLRELQSEGLIDMQQRTIRLLAPSRLALRR